MAVYDNDIKGNVNHLRKKTPNLSKPFFFLLLHFLLTLLSKKWGKKLYEVTENQSSESPL